MKTADTCQNRITGVPLVRRVICCYHSNWSNGGPFPARKELNGDDSLLLAATIVGRRPDRLYPFSTTPPPPGTFPLNSFLSSSLLLKPCERFKRAQILINLPWPPKNRSKLAGESKQTNALMSGLDCLRSCTATPQAHLVIACWKVNITLQ